MQYIREVINQGLSQRAAAGIKVRQPLNTLNISGAPLLFDEMDEEYLAIIREELNVKAVQADTKGKDHLVKLDTSVTPELRREGLVREAIRNIQSARKEAGLEVSDHISLSLSTSDEGLRSALREHEQLITSETLAAKLVFDQTFDFSVDRAVDDLPLTISLQKHS